MRRWACVRRYVATCGAWLLVAACGGEERAPYVTGRPGTQGADADDLPADGGGASGGDASGARSDAGGGSASDGIDAGAGAAVPDAGPEPVDPCADPDACPARTFGEDLPDAAWLDFTVLAGKEAFDGDLAGWPIATGFREQSHLHVTSDGTVFLWDDAVMVAPDSTSYFAIGEVLVLEGGRFVQWMSPDDFTAGLVLPDRRSTDALHVRAMDVLPGSDRIYLLSEWAHWPADVSEATHFMLLAVYDTSRALVQSFRFLDVTRLDFFSQSRLSVDAHGRAHAFDQDAARIVAPNGGTLLDVQGWYWSNFRGFQVDDNGVIFLHADDGSSNQRIETVSRADGSKTVLVTRADFEAAASDFVGASVTPEFGPYQSLGAGILGATNDDAHTLIYAISADGEIRFLKDLGAGGYVYALEYDTASGAMYLLRNDEGGDPQILHNAR